MGIAAYVGSIGAVHFGWNLIESMVAGACAAAAVAAILALPIGAFARRLLSHRHDRFR